MGNPLLLQNVRKGYSPFLNPPGPRPKRISKVKEPFVQCEWIGRTNKRCMKHDNHNGRHMTINNLRARGYGY